ncbi:MAG: KaiC domain-containing protein, partial [Candidatus Anstonellales archaeon]
TKLDEMFYYFETHEGRLMRKTLNGLPYLSVMNFVGSPDTGKSLFSLQFAVFQASMGYNVCILSTETQGTFLYNAIKERCLVMAKPFDTVARNIVVVDISQEEKIMEDINRVLQLLDEAIESKQTTITIVDSATGLYEHKELKARVVTRKLYNFLKQKKQTSILISQKRTSQDQATVESAGGLGVAHIVDGSIVFDKKIITTKYDETLYGIQMGSILRTIRIDGCRMCSHDQKTRILNISEAGIVEIGEELNTILKRL